MPRRNNGPIVSLDAAAGAALSVQYTGFAATRELETFLLFDPRRDLDDFQRGAAVLRRRLAELGLRRRATATSPTSPAPRCRCARTCRPARSTALPPYFLRDGTGGNDWLPAGASTLPGQALPYQILPPAEMPQVVNPRRGFFVNANNDPAGTTLDNNPLNQLRPGGGIYYLNVGLRRVPRRAHHRHDPRGAGVAAGG